MTRDEFLCKKMGKCYHDWDFVDGMSVCRKCKMSLRAGDQYQETFSTWEWFGKLWKFAKEQEWWIDFKFQCWTNQTTIGNTIDDWYIHPDRFADAVSRYLGWEEKND